MVIIDDREETNVILEGEGYIPVQGNSCSNPLVVGELPYSDSGNTSLYIDTGWSQSPDVWYEWRFDECGFYTITTCNAESNFDTHIRLIADDCETQITDSGNDCSEFSSSLSTIDCIFLDSGTYYILVEGANIYEGEYRLIIYECPDLITCCDYSDPLNPVCTDDVIPSDCNEFYHWIHFEEYCIDVPCLVPCSDCPPEGIPEEELCGEDINGGCDMPEGTEYFTPISCGETICGTLWIEDEEYDTDWFDIDLTNVSSFTMNIMSDIPVQIHLVYSNSGWGIVDCPSGYSMGTMADRCTPRHYERNRPGPDGHYILQVKPKLTYIEYDYPCGWLIGNNYVFSVDCVYFDTPDTPENVSITIDSNNVVLNWDEVPGATGYNIYRSADPYSFGDIYDTATENSFTDMDAALDDFVFYYITALN